jgi:hypothetical protein
MSASNSLSLYFPPSEHLVRKRENIKRLERIKVLITLDKYGSIPLEKEENSIILNDQNLFMMAFTKHPTLADKISSKIPQSILNDEEFMIEMYHLTKYVGIFGIVSNRKLFTRLLGINLAFFDYAFHGIYNNNCIMHECLRTFPKLISSPFLPVYIKEEFRMVKKSIKYINSTKTFLLCVNQKSSKIYWMRGHNNFYEKIISEYLKPIMYPVNKFVSNESLVPILPELLYQKCMNVHTKCLHCSNRLLFTSYSCCKNMKKLPKVKQLFCKNCPNLDERKQWVEIIRKKASKVYGFRVV